jgi:hypothetical protein
MEMGAVPFKIKAHPSTSNAQGWSSKSQGKKRRGTRVGANMLTAAVFIESML